jgi:hypothetical protein
VRARVADADRLRRMRDESRRVWRAAPLAAAVCLAIAAAARWAGWSPLVPLGVMVLGGAALAVGAAIVRRHRDVSDRVAAALDAHASMNGELRSAHWFAHQEAADPWVDFHLRRASERLQAVDWNTLYPAPRVARARIASVVMAAGALALALIGPGRASAVADAVTPDSRHVVPRTRGAIESLPPELRKKLEDLLAAVESGRAGALTGAEVRDLLAQLDELRGGKAPDKPKLQDGKQPDPANAPTAADLKALAERAKKGSENAALQPEARDGLAEMSDDLSDAAAEARKNAPKELQDAVQSKDVQQGEGAKSQSSGENAAPSGQSMKDTAGAGSVGVMMMTRDSGAGGDPGFGPGQGADPNAGRGPLPDLSAALRKETIEAGTDSAGDNLPTSVRRRTEHGNATIGYAHTAAAAAEHGRSAAPPPVPEARRAAVKTYFIRKSS